MREFTFLVFGAEMIIYEYELPGACKRDPCPMPSLESNPKRA